MLRQPGNQLRGPRYIYLIDENGMMVWPSGKDGMKVDNVINNIAISDDGSLVSIGSWTQAFLFDHNGMVWNRVEPSMGNGPAVISGDGKYVATVGGSGLCFYKSENDNPKEDMIPVYQAGVMGMVTHVATTTDGK